MGVFEVSFGLAAVAMPVLETITVEAGDEVKMSMKNELTGSRFVVHADIEAVSFAASFDRQG